MDKEKALKLVDFLRSDQIKDEWFNLGSWAQPGWVDKKCGTTACAMGWASVIFDEIKVDIHGYIRFIGEKYSGNSLDVWDDIAKFFCLEEDETCFVDIFDPMYWGEYSNLVTKNMIADKIEQFLEDKEKVIAEMSNCSLDEDYQDFLEGCYEANLEG